MNVIAEDNDCTEYNEEIENAILLLESHGYVIGRHYDYLIDKWAAFYQEGMEPVLHGRVLEVDITGLCKVRCPNAVRRWVYVGEVLEFFNTKSECYKVWSNKRK